MSAPERLSLNQATIKRATLPEAVELCRRYGIGAIGVWRDRLAETGVEAAAGLLTRAGLAVSSLCRGGFLTAAEGDERVAALADNRAAIDEAAAIGAATLVLVVGGLPAGDTDLVAARRRVAEAVDELAPYAQQRGVRLALEPLHPMYCADRSVLSLLDQALDVAAPYPADLVGVAVDTFHLWWDPRYVELIARAGAERRIATYQVCGAMNPFPADLLLGRALPGDGPVDVPAITRAVAATGYDLPVEVEVFNQQVWDTDPAEVVPDVVDRFARLVSPHL